MVGVDDISHSIDPYVVPKSHEILMFVCLRKDAKL